MTSRPWSLVHLCVFIALAALARAADAAVDVTDDSGHHLRLALPARRVVSLGPHITELLFAVGAGDRIVAATEYSDFPEAARRIPRVGGLAGIDLERVVAARPDLVIAWQSGTADAQLEALTRLGIPVFRSEPRTLEDVATSLERFGVLTGTEAVARGQADAFRRGVGSLRQLYADRSPVRVFFQVWNQPLMTIGGPHLITGVIELCGGRNVFASIPLMAPTVDAEAVIAADPQLIVTAAESDDHSADLALWSRWTSVSAVRDRRYLFLDPAVITRHTPRILDGAAALCKAIAETRANVSRP